MAISKYSGNVNAEEFYKRYLPDPYFMRRITDKMMEKAMSKVARRIAEQVKDKIRFPRDDFDVDLNRSMIYVGEGYDPYNHVGCNVVLQVIANEKGQAINA